MLRCCGCSRRSSTRGLFEHPFADIHQVASVVGSPEHAQLARTAAERAVVLLQNHGAALPLDAASITTLAVIGPNADKVRLGTYSGEPSYFVTVLDGIRERLGDTVVVEHAEGVRISEPDTEPKTNKITPYGAPTRETDTELIRRAVETARAANAVVLVLGGNEAVSREAFGTLLSPDGVYGDTDELELPGPTERAGARDRRARQADRRRALERPPVLDPAAVRVGAGDPGGLVPGQETGHAIAGILFGDVNPSGRLPVTIARNVGQVPAFYYRKPTARLGYVFNDNSPLYPFGHGLSYTEFAYGEPVLDRAQIDRAGTATVSVEVTNIGGRPGVEVVQAVRASPHEQRRPAHHALGGLRTSATGTRPERDRQLCCRARAARRSGTARCSAPSRSARSR